MTYKSLTELVEHSNHSGIYQNESGELVTIRHKTDEDGSRFEVVTSQNNGWERTNIYWEDGTVEELYHKA